MKTLDALNCRFGKWTIFHGAQGVEARWSMRRELKSPSYTTRLADIPKVLCWRLRPWLHRTGCAMFRRTLILSCPKTT